MKTIHAFSIALLLGLAAALGGFAATRTVDGQPGARGRRAARRRRSSQAARHASTAGSTSLQRALHRRLPKLPTLTHFARSRYPRGRRLRRRRSSRN